MKITELTPQAQQRAHENFPLDYDWWDYTYDYAIEQAALLGITISTKPVRLMSGKTREDPAIYFSGFWSQGDGSCFDGNYRYAKGAPKAVTAELVQVAKDLQAIQKKNFYKLTATIKAKDNYISVQSFKDDDYTDCDELEDALKDFNAWIYKSLEAEYEYRSSFEQFLEDCEANDYDYDESGKLV